MKILHQHWYQRPGKKWHYLPKYNLTGKHVTIIDIGDLTVKEVFCVHNCITSCTVKFTNGTFFNYEFMKDALYLNAEFTVIKEGIIKVEIDLCWYTLGYSYKLIGMRRSFKQSNETIKKLSHANQSKENKRDHIN